MNNDNIADLVRKLFLAYQTDDRRALEELLSDDFRFSSPYDYQIDREAYFERCWPSSKHIRTHRIQKLVTEGSTAFVLYEAELHSGVRFRNTEHMVFEGEKLTEVEVFFGEAANAAGPPTAANDQVRRLVEQRADAVRARNVGAAMAAVADDVVAFDDVGPLRHEGSSEIEERTASWFSSFSSPIGMELRDLCIVGDDSVAFAYSLNHYSAGAVDMWVRSTSCFQKRDGSWQIVHQHDSVPFDAESGKASVDLKP